MKKLINNIKEFILGLIKRYENLGYKVKKKIKFIIGRIFLYYVLIELAYLFILPFIYIFTTALMSSQDYMDPTVQYIPTHINWENFSKAWMGLDIVAVNPSLDPDVTPALGDYYSTLLNTVILSLGSAILQSISCALVGYSLGRFKFRGRMLIMLFVIIILLIPPQTLITSSFFMWSQLRMAEGFYAILIPTIFGHGLRGALFILIYMYFFQRIPDVMDDAARIDGAGPVRVFAQIMFPLVKSAFTIVFIFSFVWHWNDNQETITYTYLPQHNTLQEALSKILTNYLSELGFSGGAVSEAMKATAEPVLFAGCLMVMLPVLLVYLLGQKKLVAGIERIGVIE